ncbi:MAG TPA: family 43 glycosylhydrolase [Acidobacteriaceae bacterium]|jgi:hypothetical protein|nr:family 43 glycosylhydrolase [Acidobacteriaceae bacterium]
MITPHANQQLRSNDTIEYTSLPARSHLLRSAFFTLLIALLSCAWVRILAQSPHSPAAQENNPSSNPILPGDHPDPTILRVGTTYWTTSTSGNWAPEFPLFRSTDLHRWTAAGAVFPRTPAWASGSFWAPEMVYEQGRIIVYYVGRKRGGPLCVAAATAPEPQGPYTDHGPIVCQPDGSIDPAMARDKHGRPFLIWKEDGNSIGKSTPIWAQPLTADLLHVTGDKTQLLVNDPSTWEGGVVEAPYILRHAGRFYLFYAGNACCGVACRYAEGVARADHLLGPWTKDPANPMIRPNAAWKCPGHGTAVETPSGEDYFLYHAYPANGTVFLGRESVLDRITWTADGWPVVNNGQGPSGRAQSIATQPSFTDDFRKPTLGAAWQWPVGRSPTWQIHRGTLTIVASGEDAPGFLARSLTGSTYVATVGVLEDGGLGVLGGARSQLTLSRQGNHLELWRIKRTDRQLLWHADIAPASVLWLRASSYGLANTAFSYSTDRTHWTAAGPVLNVSDLLPWDQGLRIGLVATDPPGARTSFVHFSMEAAPEKDAKLRE